MRVPFNWLKEYLKTDLPAFTLAEKLTLSGTEVKGIEGAAGEWEHVFVGQITEKKQHPNADRLLLVTVDWGGGTETVITGAPNIKVGDKVAFARMGARLIDGHTGKPAVLKTINLRGIESSGMVCSEMELGISMDHSGIMVLPPEAPLGQPLAEYMGEPVLDLELTPNRPDLLSIVGVARELGAIIDKKAEIAETTFTEGATDIASKLTVAIDDVELCPRYTGGLVSGVKVGESPDWLKRRLVACGLRPINNIVDITNYVMVEYGQPLHAFDYNQIKGQKIIVRKAAAGEGLTTLDGTERKLAAEMLVIADAERAVAVAGVMGGANSEVNTQTTAVLIEAANFSSASIRGTAAALRLPSEASLRFEKGISPELAPVALKRALRLILELAGGEAAKGIADNYPGKKDARLYITMSMDRMKLVLGMDPDIVRVNRMWDALGFTWLWDMSGDAAENGWGGGSNNVLIYPPYWRRDIERDVDLIEEIGRILGYDLIPTRIQGNPLPAEFAPVMISLKRVLRRHLVGQGFQEMVSYSLTSLEALKKLNPGGELPVTPLKVVNPMTPDQECLRTSLRAGLLSALAANRRFEEGGLRLFELGRVYLPRPNDLPQETEILCGLLAGSRNEAWWQNTGEQYDFYDARGVIEGLLARVKQAAEFVPSSDPSLFAGRQAEVRIAGQRIGILGEIDPVVSRAFDLDEKIILFEIDVAALLTCPPALRPFQPLPRYPAVVRDLALVVDTGVTNGQVLSIIRSYPLVSQVSLFDVYSGPQVPSEKKSLAYRLSFQSPAQTLTDAEVDSVQAQILERLSTELGASLRT